MKRQVINSLALVLLSLLLFGFGACNRGTQSTPTATTKTFFETARNKDVEGFKRTLSKNSLDILERRAKAQEKTLDDSIRAGMESLKMSSMPEMRNEKINGNSATLEVKDKDTDWETIPFVKEEGQWKIAFDVMMNNAGMKPDESGHSQ